MDETGRSKVDLLVITISLSHLVLHEIVETCDMVLASPVASPGAKSEGRLSNASSAFLDEKEFLFLSQRSEKHESLSSPEVTPSSPETFRPVDPARRPTLPSREEVRKTLPTRKEEPALSPSTPQRSPLSLLLVVPREIWGIVVVDTFGLVGGFLSVFGRWASGLLKRVKNCVVSTVGLLGAFA